MQPAASPVDGVLGLAIAAVGFLLLGAASIKLQIVASRKVLEHWKPLAGLLVLLVVAYIALPALT